MKTRFTLLLALGCLAFAGHGHAALAYSTAGTTYTQDFDSLETSGTGHAWLNDTTLAGWHLFRQPDPGIALTTYDASTGSATAGSIYSYGSSGSSDRALGGLGAGNTYWGGAASGTVAGWISLALENNTGNTLRQFTVTFDGEQWRTGGGSNPTPQTMHFEFGIGATFGTVPTWTAPGGAFDWTSPVVASGSAVDGNADGKVAGVGGTVSGLLWEPGQTLWLRWVEMNDVGNDHGLAIDNLSFTAVVPEPSDAAALVALGLSGFAWYRRQIRRTPASA